MRAFFLALVSNKHLLQGGVYLKNWVLFQSVGWLFENYLVLFGVICCCLVLIKRFWSYFLKFNKRPHPKNVQVKTLKLDNLISGGGGGGGAYWNFLIIGSSAGINTSAAYQGKTFKTTLKSSRE